jgi:hypothetical protein
MPPADRLEDTSALAAMVDENRQSYSLDNLCKWRGLPGKDEALLRATVETTFGVKCGVRKNKPQAYIARLPAHIVGPYGAADAAQTLLLFESLLPEVRKEGAEAKDGYLTLCDGARRHYSDWEARGIAWGKGNMAPCGIEEARRRVRDPSHPWFGQRLQRAGAYFAMNALIQGNGARQAKLWMRACWREGIIPHLMMHDGLELSIKSPDVAERVAQLGREVMT